jgi:hypothetical protein
MYGHAEGSRGGEGPFWVLALKAYPESHSLTANEMFWTPPMEMVCPVLTFWCTPRGISSCNEAQQLKSTFFCDVKPCNMLHRYQRFEEPTSYTLSLICLDDNSRFLCNAGSPPSHCMTSRSRRYSLQHYRKNARPYRRVQLNWTELRECRIQMQLPAILVGSLNISRSKLHHSFKIGHERLLPNPYPPLTCHFSISFETV